VKLDLYFLGFMANSTHLNYYKTDNSCVTFLLLLDYSKAFNTVNHEILCSKLKNLYFFSNTAVKLLCSCLKNRRQYVVSSNICSSFAYLNPRVRFLDHYYSHYI